MKTLNSFVFIILFSLQAIGQNEFIQIETNKVICLLSFLEASANQPGSSSSYTSFIMEHLGADEEFVEQINLYSSLNLEYSAKREKYPEKRHNSINTKDLLWVAASNAQDISDFSERITGHFPHRTQIELVSILEKTESYYDELIWNKEQKSIHRVERELAEYKDEIETLFLKLSGFYNAKWDKKVPFKISLYPIPIKQGMTTATPKGNALICGYMTEDKMAYQGLLGIAIHEMCHIIYDEQNLEFQKQIDEWYNTSESPYAALAYNYLNEGLATALGNGWAYEQINGSLDTADWYADKYIDGFGHALYPLVSEYIAEGISMDHDFVKKSISLFRSTFPKAINDTGIMMNSITIFTNSEEDQHIDAIFDALFSNFNIQSIDLSIPISDPKSVEVFGKKNATKLFVIDLDHDATINFMDKSFPHLDISTPSHSMDVILDTESNSYMIVVNIEEFSNLPAAMEKLSQIEQLESGSRYEIEE